MDSYVYIILYKRFAVGILYIEYYTHWQVPGVMHVPFFSSQPGAQIAVKKNKIKI